MLRNLKFNFTSYLSNTNINYYWNVKFIFLCQVNIEENETESLPAVENHTTPSASLGSEAENVADTDGPKIVDVICGVAGANEFFQSSLPNAYSISNEAKSFLEIVRSLYKSFLIWLLDLDLIKMEVASFCLQQNKL